MRSRKPDIKKIEKIMKLNFYKNQCQIMRWKKNNKKKFDAKSC